MVLKKNNTIKEKGKTKNKSVKLSVQSIVSALNRCIDPELGINIVDLGFVYGIKINGDEVNIRITLSSPMCPLAGMITDNINRNVKKIKGVKSLSIEVVWDPPWSMDMFSEEFKKQFEENHTQ